MKVREKHCLFLIVLFMFGIIIFKPDFVFAANPSKVSLKPGITYKGYDITGDKKKDVILIKPSKDRYGYYDGLSIYINGKSKYKFSGQNYYDIEAKLYTLKNGKPFLYLFCVADNYDGPVCGLFQYKSGKLSKIINFQNMFPNCGGHPSGKIVKVSGNTIKVQFYLMSWTLGPSYYRYNYTYKDGTLKRSNTIGTIYVVYARGGKTKNFTAGKTITAYTSASAKKVAYTLRQGSRIVVDKIYRGSYGTWIRGKYNGKFGWIKCTDHYPINEPQMFTNVGYAG